MTPPLDTGFVKGNELDRIYNDPNTSIALDLFERFTKKTLDEEGFKAFLATLPPEAAPEIAKIEQLLADPTVRVESDISTYSGQLAWAAALGYAHQNSKPGTVRQHAVWRTLMRNSDVQSSLGTAARYLDLSSTNRNATMNWGTPGSWFWFSPDKNHINIDLFNTLLLGFSEAPAPGMRGIAHATGVMMHEVGHSQLTTRWTDGMKALQEREDALVAANKERKLTRDEYKELVRTRTEFKLRANVMNAAEDNCVNRYAANQGKEFPHDFAKSLNICNVVLQGTGYYLKTKENKPGEHSDFSEIAKDVPDGVDKTEVEKAREALTELSKALMMAFYASNGLFDGEDADIWRKLGIDPDKITGTDGSTFSDLMKANIGRDGIASLQPSARDRWLLRSLFAQSVANFADRRCKIIDEIWDKYAAPYARAMLDAAEEDAENRMNQKAQQNKGEQQDGEGQDGEGQSQGKGQKGQKGQKGGQPGQSGGGQGGDDAAPSQGMPGGGDDDGEEQSGSEEGDGIDVEGVGKMDAGEGTPSSPQQAQKEERQGQGEDDVDTDNANTVRDLAQEAKQQEKKDGAEQNGDGQDGEGKDGNGQDASDKNDGSQPGDLSMDKSNGAGRQNVDLSRLSSGDWKEFRRRINELEPVISRITDDFRYIRDKQKQFVRKIANDCEQLPRGGGALRQRLDMRAHMNLAAKRGRGELPEPADLNRWRKDQVQPEATSVELWILGDGSGSMEGGMASGGRMIDACVQTMAILYESGKRTGFDCYVGMWGNEDMEIIAKPGDTEKTIGEQFGKVQDGLGSGTTFSPSLVQAIDLSTKPAVDKSGRPKRFAGMTHFLVVSDGDLDYSDVQPTVDRLTQLFKYGPMVSVDIAILTSGRNTAMDEVVEQVRKNVPGALIDIVRASDSKTAPLLLAGRVKKRFEKSSRGIKAVPDRQKREAFSNAHKVMRR